LSVGHSRLALISESHNAVLGTKENQVNTKTAVKLPVISGIAFTVTPEQAMEMIKHLSSYAIDGKPFEVLVHTASESWSSDTPVATVTCGGFMRVQSELKYSYTTENKVETVHYDSTKVGA
jgi:hypothetical protein